MVEPQNTKEWGILELKKAVKLTIAIAILSIFAAVPHTQSLVGSPYGPEREIFTLEKRPNYVTFNSITNNPAWADGDERIFVQIKAQDDLDDAYSSRISRQRRWKTFRQHQQKIHTLCLIFCKAWEQ